MLVLRREALTLLVGDILFLIVALWATLLVRYVALPSTETFLAHLVPFTFLFALSILVFFIAGLYDKQTLIFKARLPGTILYAQIANIVIGALYFFLIPYFGIQPKTNLIIYLIVSSTLLSLWRLRLFPRMVHPAPVKALLVGTGDECAALAAEVNGNTRYAFRFSATCAPDSSTAERVQTEGAAVVVLPLSHGRIDALVPQWHDLARSVKFIDLGLLYEELFDRVLLTQLDERWFVEEFTHAHTIFYGAAKRCTDIVVSALGLVVLSPLILVVFVLLKAQGTAFIVQERVGRAGKRIGIWKFRTMLFDDKGDPERQKANRVTALGALLRKTQVDEIPQFWNVLKGDLSLIGPRPEIPALVEAYEKAIPFYTARHLIAPGMSGWAQIKHASPPKFALDVARTRDKLSYDLYYLKHRSFLLDIAIALQTLKIVLARAGK